MFPCPQCLLYKATSRSDFPPLVTDGGNVPPSMLLQRGSLMQRAEHSTQSKGLSPCLGLQQPERLLSILSLVLLLPQKVGGKVKGETT